MKKLFLIILFTLFSATVFAQNNSEDVIRLSDPVSQTDKYEVFGEANEIWDKSITLDDLITKDEDYLNKEILVETEVSQVCQKKGCFFVAQSVNGNARITFKDYGFFIPTNSAGKKVILKGVFSVTELSAEQNKHYQEDLTGKSVENAESVKEYSIVASSILIPKD